MNVAYVRCDRCGAQTPTADAGRYGHFCGALWAEPDAFDLCPACSDAVQRFVSLGRAAGDDLLARAYESEE